MKTCNSRVLKDTSRILALKITVDQRSSSNNNNNRKMVQNLAKRLHGDF